MVLLLVLRKMVVVVKVMMVLGVMLVMVWVVSLGLFMMLVCRLVF